MTFWFPLSFSFLEVSVQKKRCRVNSYNLKQNSDNFLAYKPLIYFLNTTRNMYSKILNMRSRTFLYILGQTFWYIFLWISHTKKPVDPSFQPSNTFIPFYICTPEVKWLDVDELAFRYSGLDYLVPKYSYCDCGHLSEFCL